MAEVLTFSRESSIGFKVASLRIHLHWTQQELADIAGIAKDDVDFFEHNLPVPLEIKQKLIRALWTARRASKR